MKCPECKCEMDIQVTLGTADYRTGETTMTIRYTCPVCGQVVEQTKVTIARPPR